jgi:protein-L-isoaspartate(D-aspartate) O-methyltransferase
MVGSVTDDRLHRYATNVTAYVSDPAVVDAFVRVPREHFVHAVIGNDGRPVPVTLDQVYSDEALVTRVRDGLPSSSSSQPSLMAEMLAALRLRPGDRVLEVGTGTGYNSALIATITGAPVVTVDVQPDVVADATAALEGLNVTAIVGDGYLGAPGHGPFDRIIATVGVGGIPPAWFEQLAPDGRILAPVEHGGIQPCLAVTAARSGPTGRGAVRSGFMLAAGRLHPRAAAPAAIALPDPPERVPMPAVAQNRYYELWFGLAAWDGRVERRLAGDLVEGVWPGPATACTVTDPSAGSVVVGLDALYPVRASEDLVTHVSTLVERWHAAGGPAVADWYCDLAFGDGLWTPTGWRLGP